MKQVSISFLLAFYFLTAPVRAQLLEMSADEISHARIKSAIISSEQFGAATVSEEPSRREAYTFDRSGFLVGRITYNADDTPGTSAIFRYDEHGNRIFHEITLHENRITPNVSYEYLYENGRILREANNNTSLVRHYFYDAFGHVSREELRDGKSHVVETIYYSYDDEGNLIAESSEQEFIQRSTTMQYDAEGNLIEKKKTSTYTFENARTTFSCEKYVYDVEGRMMHLLRLDASGKIVSYLNFAYDEQGRLASKSSGKVAYRYDYNDEGMLARRRKLVAGKVVEAVNYEYRYYDPIQDVKVASQK